MTQRKAVIVAGAAGPESDANTVLQRFGFGKSTSVPDLTALLRLLRDHAFDLVIVPLQDMGPVELATLEREVVRGGTTMVIGTAPQAEPGFPDRGPGCSAGGPSLRAPFDRR